MIYCFAAPFDPLRFFKAMKIKLKSKGEDRSTVNSRYKLISTMRCMLGRYAHRFLESLDAMRCKLAASLERGAYNENLLFIVNS